MITLNYSVHINAPREKVWQILWDDASYRKWTSAFMEGSYAESTWQEGDRISFLTPDNNGMFGVIEKKIDNTEMSFRHVGEIKNGVDEVKDWQDATERYFLADQDGGTLLTAVLTMSEDNKDFEGYFNEAFPKGLAILKSLCES